MRSLSPHLNLCLLLCTTFSRKVPLSEPVRFLAVAFVAAGLPFEAFDDFAFLLTAALLPIKFRFQITQHFNISVSW